MADKWHKSNYPGIDSVSIQKENLMVNTTNIGLSDTIGRVNNKGRLVVGFLKE